MPKKIERTEAEWKQQLSPEQFSVCRQKGTERAFTGRYWSYKELGMYHCICCGNVLFSSEAKYDSGTGWPSFSAPFAEEQISTQPDGSLETSRTEVLCSRCDAHLGHRFDDGPTPSGQRYCINSTALKFVKPS